MGLDLLFRPRGRKPPSKRDFLRHFEGRPNFEPHASQASFRDDDTGAHFEFFLGDFRDDRAVGPLGRPWASFYMNYIRPGWLPYQAIPEIEAICEAFDLTCEYVDAAPGEACAFDAEALFDEWTDGNLQCIRHMVMLDATQRLGEGGELSQLDAHYPTEPLWNFWKWNWSRGGDGDAVAGGMFVPPVCYVRRGGDVLSAVIWPDAIPILLPRVDVVLLVPDGQHRAADDIPEAFRVADFAIVEPLIARYRTAGEPVSELFAIDYDSPPKELAELHESVAPTKAGALELLDPGMVLEREIVAEMVEAQKRGDDGDGRWKSVRAMVKNDQRH